MALGSAILVVQLLLLLHSLPFTSASDPYNHPHHHNFHPSKTAVITAVILASIFVLGFFSIYLQRCGRRNGRFQPRTPLAWRQQRGLDREVIESFPTMLYAEVRGLRKSRGSCELECAVCLSEFGEEETLRLLPKCNHAFHPDCIDVWLATHTSCPVCRSDLAEGVQGIEKTEEVPEALGANDLPVEAAQQSPECVIVEVEEASTPSSTAVEESKSGRAKPSWRSRSAAVGRFACWTEDDRERFTLRLPDSVRTDLKVRMKGLTRSASVAAYPVAAVDAVNLGSSCSASEMLASGEGSSTWVAGERRVLCAREWEPSAKSDRWAALVRTLPLKGFNDSGDRSQ